MEPIMVMDKEEGGKMGDIIIETGRHCMKFKQFPEDVHSVVDSRVFYFRR